MIQVSSLSTDLDTGSLTIRLASGEEYRINSANTAQSIRDKLEISMKMTPEQKAWLDANYRYISGSNRAEVRDKIRKLRQELKRK